MEERSETALDGSMGYRYQQEIAQMVRRCSQMFVFTEIESPDAHVTRLIEDIVRNQVVEMVRSC